ncbi:MAG TPA: YHS domain-containing (seleno)protein [Ferruginibacter sp.]|jgi:YHS domain-containing protein|nr:YHS domain-containing (seleno)protein [Ferruginibacter sp.]
MNKILFTTFFLSLLTTALFAQDATTLRKKKFNLDNGLAIQGYDPVCYFTQNKAVKGSNDFTLSEQGVTYYFSSAANRDAFKVDPAKYEPQYGGWCAYAMGTKGEKVDINPETFKLINGKLYLFYNKWFNNTLTDWNKDEANLKKNADINWPKIYR